jgi:hypothetical protein
VRGEVDPSGENLLTKRAILSWSSPRVRSGCQIKTFFEGLKWDVWLVTVTVTIATTHLPADDL